MRRQPHPASRPRSITLPLACIVGFALACFGPAGVDELIIEDIEVGSGDAVEVGDRASLHYTGWVYDPGQPNNRGRFFDSSRNRGVPFHFNVEPGSGGVIEGWHRGVLGMRKGGRRVITIPADLAYGDEEAADGLIPAGASLVFELELVRLEKVGGSKSRMR